MLSCCLETFKSDHTGDCADERAVTEVSVSELATLMDHVACMEEADLGRLIAFMRKGLGF